MFHVTKLFFQGISYKVMLRDFIFSAKYQGGKHMNKRLPGILLFFCFMLAILPTTALVATTDNENYYANDVTWLGTTSEYQKTLKVFFDDTGLRKVAVNGRYGLVNMAGNFVAQPIYDQIEAYYWHKENGHTKKTNESKKGETIFVNGYVQAIRNGKMGLLDTTGREVIPCNYDAVGLPSEGICRISKKANGKTWIGYWNLELDREIVPPNKYPLPEHYEDCGTAEGGILSSIGFFLPDGHRLAAAFDFYKGYALVPTEKVLTVTEKSHSGSHDRTRKLVYAQIIDKNGREVLIGGPYPFNINPSVPRAYPQAGPYMVYDQLSTKRLRMIADAGGYDVIFNSHLESGIVGPKGILVPAQYHGGIWGSSQLGWYPPGAQIQIIPELSLAITNKCGYDGFKEGAAVKGLINFSNRAIIPFGSLVHLSYDSDNKVFLGGVFEPVYRPDGTKIPGTAGRAGISLHHGYVMIGDSDDHGNITSLKNIISIKTGKSCTHENLKGSSCTPVSG